MKHLNIYLEDKEYDDLVKEKKDLTWKKFILTLIKKEEEIDG